LDFLLHPAAGAENKTKGNTMITELKNKLAILTVIAAANSLLAGSFSHGDRYESTNGTINYGPLGDLSVNGIDYKELNGPVSAGTYGIYQSVTQTDGGESSTYINW
jgi:hypothetical protein